MRRGLALCALALAACQRPVDPADLRPVGPGEQLTFQLSYLDLPVGVGSVELGERGGCWELTARGEVSVAGLFEARGTTVDLLDAAAQRTVSSEQVVEEGGRLRRESLRIDQDGTVRVHREQPGPPTDKTFADRPAASVALSALYGLRARPLAPGERRRLDVFDGAATLALDVEATRTLELQTHFGPRRVTELVITGAPKGPLRVFLTDDATRLPVRLEAALGAGVAVLEVTDYLMAAPR